MAPDLKGLSDKRGEGQACTQVTATGSGGPFVKSRQRATSWGEGGPGLMEGGAGSVLYVL